MALRPLALLGAGIEGGSLSFVDVLSRTATWGKPCFSLVDMVTLFSTVLGLKDFF